MITHQQLEQHILELPEMWLDFPFGKDVSVYKYGKANDGAGKMVALIAHDAVPVRLSLKCDPQLAEILREQYETVLPGYHLNKKHWNTIICSGQLGDDELFDLIRHSYELAKTND